MYNEHDCYLDHGMHRFFLQRDAYATHVHIEVYAMAHGVRLFVCLSQACVLSLMVEPSILLNKQLNNLIIFCLTIF